MTPQAAPLMPCPKHLADWNSLLGGELELAEMPMDTIRHITALLSAEAASAVVGDDVELAKIIRHALHKMGVLDDQKFTEEGDKRLMSVYIAEHINRTALAQRGEVDEALSVRVDNSASSGSCDQRGLPATGKDIEGGV